MTVDFFVSADGGKVGKPIAIWKSKSPRYFREANAAAKRDQVSYFSNPKSFMQVDIMKTILEQLNREVKMQSRSDNLFMCNTSVHLESLIGKYRNIKSVSLPKNTTLHLEPLDACIIKSFKMKYRKTC